MAEVAWADGSKIDYSRLLAFFDSEVCFVQLDMEDGDEIDAMLHQTGGRL